MRSVDDGTCYGLVDQRITLMHTISKKRSVLGSLFEMNHVRISVYFERAEKASLMSLAFARLYPGH